MLSPNADLEEAMQFSRLPSRCKILEIEYDLSGHDGLIHQTHSLFAAVLLPQSSKMDHDQDPEVESEKQMLLTIENATTDCFDETQVEVTLDGTEAGKAAEEMNHDRLRCQKAKEEQEWRELYLKVNRPTSDIQTNII
jgi:hypothetical protein